MNSDSTEIGKVISSTSGAFVLRCHSFYPPRENSRDTEAAKKILTERQYLAAVSFGGRRMPEMFSTAVLSKNLGGEVFISWRWLSQGIYSYPCLRNFLIHLKGLALS
jgi:hypothetical protein